MDISINPSLISCTAAVKLAERRRGERAAAHPGTREGRRGREAHLLVGCTRPEDLVRCVTLIWPMSPSEIYSYVHDQDERRCEILNKANVRRAPLARSPRVKEAFCSGQCGRWRVTDPGS